MLLDVQPPKTSWHCCSLMVARQCFLPNTGMAQGTWQRAQSINPASKLPDPNPNWAFVRRPWTSPIHGGLVMGLTWFWPIKVWTLWGCPVVSAGRSLEFSRLVLSCPTDPWLEGAGQFGGWVNTSTSLSCSLGRSWAVFVGWQDASSCWGSTEFEQVVLSSLIILL